MTTLRLEVQPDRLRCAPGDEATLTLALRNVSDIVQHYECLVLGLPDGATAASSPEVAKLRPGESARVTVTISLATAPAPRAGDYVLGLVVRSPHDAVASRCEEFPLTVSTVDALTLSVDPQLLNGGSLAELTATVANQGNALARVHFQGNDPERRVQFVFSPTWVDVLPGGSATARASVRSRTPWTGPPQRRELTVTGRPEPLPGATPTDITAPAAFTQRAKLAPAALRSVRGLVTLAVGVATILGAALLVNRQVAPQNTADKTRGAGSPAASTSPSATSPTDTGSPSATVTTALPVRIDLTTPPGFTPAATAAPGGQHIEPVAFASKGISLIAGKPGTDAAPECTAANGAAVVNPSSTGGYVEPALPEDPTLCHSVPLQVIFSAKVTTLDVFLPAEAVGTYQLEVHLAGEPSLTQLYPRTNAGVGQPDFHVQPAATPITDVVLESLPSPTDPTPVVGIAALVVTTLVGS